MGAFGSKSHQRMPHQKSVVTAEKTHYHCGPGRAKALPTTVHGEVAEWSNVPDSKSGVGESQPWVRIPPSPPVHKKARLKRAFLLAEKRPGPHEGGKSAGTRRAPPIDSSDH